MADTKDKNIWQELRKPFPAEVVGKLPRGGITLDYVGHAAVTDRLLTIDPEWTWEPLALDERGLPVYDNGGGLWIKLTIGGVTRLGYGDGKNPKERIGDAIRNGAMRFGVALDLWSKDELESTLQHPELKNDKPSQRKEFPQLEQEYAETQRTAEEVKTVMDQPSEFDTLIDELADLMRGRFTTAQIRAAIGKLNTVDEVNAAIKKVKETNQ